MPEIRSLALNLLGIENTGHTVLPAERRSDGMVVAVAVRPVGVNQNRKGALGRNEEEATRFLFQVITRK